MKGSLEGQKMKKKEDERKKEMNLLKDLQVHEVVLSHSSDGWVKLDNGQLLHGSSRRESGDSPHNEALQLKPRNGACWLDEEHDPAIHTVHVELTHSVVHGHGRKGASGPRAGKKKRLLVMERAAG